LGKKRSFDSTPWDEKGKGEFSAKISKKKSGGFQKKVYRDGYEIKKRFEKKGTLKKHWNRGKGKKNKRGRESVNQQLGNKISSPNVHDQEGPLSRGEKTLPKRKESG